jgi:hypothetical protein
MELLAIASAITENRTNYAGYACWQGRYKLPPIAGIPSAAPASRARQPPPRLVRLLQPLTTTPDRGTAIVSVSPTVVRIHVEPILPAFCRATVSLNACTRAPVHRGPNNRYRRKNDTLPSGRGLHDDSTHSVEHRGLDLDEGLATTPVHSDTRPRVHYWTGGGHLASIRPARSTCRTRTVREQPTPRRSLRIERDPPTHR